MILVQYSPVFFTFYLSFVVSYCAKMLFSAGADIHKTGTEGWTTLMWSARNGRSLIAEVRIVMQISFNSTTIQNFTMIRVQYSPVFLTFHQRLVVFSSGKTLLSTGADIHKSDDKGWIALMLAAEKGRSQAVEVRVVMWK